MKLITHNMLTSNILKGVTKGFPLKIQGAKVDSVTVDYNRDFIARILQRIEYDALRGAVRDVSSPSRSTADFRIRFSAVGAERNVTRVDDGRHAARRRLSQNDAPRSARIRNRRRRTDLPGNRPRVPDFERHSEHVAAGNRSVVSRAAVATMTDPC